VVGLLWWEGESLKSFGTIPDVLELEAKSNGGTAWVELVQDGLQEFSEATKVHVFVGVEQPANFGDKGGLNGTGVDAVAKTLQIRPKDVVKILL